MIRIKSITDVITNSSTEVFTFADEGSVEKLKRFIDSILYIAGSEKTCDDLFEVRFKLRKDLDEYLKPEDDWGETNEYYDSIVNSYCKSKGISTSEFNVEEVSKDEKYKYVCDALLSNLPPRGGWSENYPEIIGLELIPKKKGKGKITDLSLVNNLFDLGYTS